VLFFDDEELDALRQLLHGGGLLDRGQCYQLLWEVENRRERQRQLDEEVRKLRQMNEGLVERIRSIEADNLSNSP